MITKPIIQLICFHGSDDEVRVLSKALAELTDSVVLELFDWANMDGPPPWSRDYIARVTFGNLARLSIENDARVFSLPVIWKIREDKTLREQSLSTLAELKEYIKLTLANLPESTIEIPEAKKTITKYTSEELLSLLTLDQPTIIKLKNNGNTILVGEGEEADISLKELIILRLATETLDIDSIIVERKRKDATE